MKCLLYAIIECLEPAVMELPCFKKDDAIEKLASRLSALEKAVEDFTEKSSSGGRVSTRGSLQ